MASMQQIEANRRNAQKSTGPRSDAGKQQFRDNALKHGLCSQRVVLPFEDPQEYHLLHARLVSEQQPQSTLEMLLLDRIAAAFWRLERAIGVESALMSSSVRNLKIRCKVDDRPGGRNEGIDYYEGLSICMSKDPRAFDIQIRYQTTVRRELTQMLAQLERIRRHPLPTGTEPLNLPPVEPGDVIEIPTAASSGPGDLSSAAVAQEVAVAAFSPEPPRLTLPQTDTGSPEPATPEPDCPANSEPGDAEPLRPQVSPAPRSHLREAPEAARAPSQATHSTMVNKKIGFVSQSASPPPVESLLRHSR